MIGSCLLQYGYSFKSKKNIKVLMVDKITSFKKKGKGKKGNFKKNSKQVVAQVKKPKSGPKPKTK